MRRVILESPYAGNVEGNVAYARACIRDSLERGEAPIASHLLYTQPGILNDDNPAERLWGIKAGLAWVAVADAGVFYLDLGWSNGMSLARERYEAAGIPIEHRLLPQFGVLQESAMVACSCGADVDTDIFGECHACGRAVAA